MTSISYIKIPTKDVGPIKIVGPVVNDSLSVPLSTLESPLWPSVQRGANISQKSEGIKVVVVEDSMTRSIILETSSTEYLLYIRQELYKKKDTFDKLVTGSSRYTKLIDWYSEIVGCLMYIRFKFYTCEASGHNMSTKAAHILLNFLLDEFPKLNYVSISGNICTDKKNSAINGILGRGKHIIAEMVITEKICNQDLRTTSVKIHNLNIKKNLLGSILSGGVRTANAHFGNMLMALYLATGQDTVNIIEGSQGFTYTELRNNELYFSITIPNLVLGTIGNGRSEEFAIKNLEKINCLQTPKSGKNITNSQSLAAIAGAVVLCGELSLMASQTQNGDLIRSHLLLERKKT